MNNDMERERVPKTPRKVGIYEYQVFGALSVPDAENVLDICECTLGGGWEFVSVVAVAPKDPIFKQTPYTIYLRRIKE